MKIGQALKKVRIELGLTQTEMCGEILSRSFYAKVEADKHEISADKLIKMLFFHEVDINWFFQLIREDYISEEQKKVEKLQAGMSKAVSKENIQMLEQYSKQIMELKEHKILKLRTIVTLAYFRNELDELSDEIKKEIFEEFDKGNRWVEEIGLIRLMTNTIPFWSQDRLDFVINNLLVYMDKKHDISELMQERYLRLLENYLVTSYERGVYKNPNHARYINKVLETVITTKFNFHFMLYKINAIYMRALFKDNKVQSRDIRKLMKKYGFGEFIINWPK